MMPHTLEILFWLSLCLIAYSFAGYAVLIWLAARGLGRTEVAPQLDEKRLPAMTLLIAAHNEETVIAKRLENALAVDYPRDKFQVVVASDGSSDRTAEIVRSFADRGVKLLDYQPNCGKANTLNNAWDELTTDLVLLSDANTFIDAQAPRRLARWFASPDVGAVCGRLVLVDPATGNNVDSLYWRYETFLKKCEAKLGALLGANGAIYAIRREAFVKIPPETIVDDFVIPLLAQLKHSEGPHLASPGGRGNKTGFHLVYDEEAAAHEETPADMGDEFRRRARIGAGGFQSIGILWRLLNPKYGWLAFSFFSHKVLRWFCPFFMLAMLASNLALIELPLYRWTLAAQIAFYLVALCGRKLPGQAIPVRLVRLATMFSSMNLALLVGFFRWISGRQRGVWSRTARRAPV